MDVAHLAWRHRYDSPRIYQRECLSLSRNGYNTSYIVPCGEHTTNKSADEVDIIDVSPAEGQKYNRYFKSMKRMYSAALQRDANIYHIHEPELIPIGIFLKIDGKKVIYDSHELTRHQKWGAQIPLWQKLPETIGAVTFEKTAAKLFDGIVAATPTIRENFPEEKSVTVKNFPKLKNVDAAEQAQYRDRPNNAVYVGGISQDRGIKEMVEAMSLLPEHLNIRLQIAGGFSTEQLRGEVTSMEGWDRVDFHGWISHERVFKLLGESMVGMSPLYKIDKYKNSIPNKIFEYMSAGLPVIASDFDSWEQFLRDPSCGRFIDPTSPREIAEQIQWIFENEARAELMGENARRMVESEYNWESQAEKLLELYHNI